jgi:hypothetical protein
MESRDFLKNACTQGLCGCVGMSFLTGSPLLANSKSAQSEEKLDMKVCLIGQ